MLLYTFIYFIAHASLRVLRTRARSTRAVHAAQLARTHAEARARVRMCSNRTGKVLPMRIYIFICCLRGAQKCSKCLRSNRVGELCRM